MMKVCYFGGYDPAYARNRVLLRGLRLAGAEVIECVDRGPKLLRPLRLAYRFLVRARDADVIIVGASGHAYVPIARALATAARIPLVFDAFISQYDTNVTDRRAARPGSRRARRFARMDRRATRMADLVLMDTEQHARFYAEQTGTPESKFRSLWIGADTELFRPMHTPSEDGSFRVVFVGNFIPLQGVPVILRAIHALRDEKDIKFTFIGRGQTYAEARALADELEIDVTFRDPVPPERVPEACAPADVILGIFDTGGKAARVIPNKVYEGMAMGKPVVTADTPASRSLLTDGVDARLVPPGDPGALARAIQAMRDEPAARQAIGERGLATLRAHATPEVLGRRLLEWCEEAAGARGSIRHRVTSSGATP